MSEKCEEYPITPESFKEKTIETMPFETVYFMPMGNEPWDDSNEDIWIDRDNGRLRTRSDVALDEKEFSITKRVESLL